MRRSGLLWLHFVCHGHFAERLGHYAFNVRKAADDLQAYAYVAVSDAGLNGARQVFSLCFPNRIAFGLSRKLDGRVWHDLKMQFPGGHSRRYCHIG